MRQLIYNEYSRQEPIIEFDRLAVAPSHYAPWKMIVTTDDDDDDDDNTYTSIVYYTLKAI